MWYLICCQLKSGGYRGWARDVKARDQDEPETDIGKKNVKRKT